MTNEQIQAVTIAGNDSDGSAGMPADLHAFFARDVYGMGILTAAVAGNSHSIAAAEVMPPDFIAKQFEMLAADFDIKAAKTGMLSDSTTIDVVADSLIKYDFGAIVIDPVIITKHGAMLLAEEAYETFRKRLIPLATVITPNFYEAQKLTDLELSNPSEIEAGAKLLQNMGAKNVLIKGRHDSDEQDVVSDFLLLADGSGMWLTEKYVKTNRVNGTGDTLSAVIAAELAKGNDVATAISIAKKFVHEAITNEIEVGHQFGPINHWAGMDYFEK